MQLIFNSKGCSIHKELDWACQKASKIYGNITFAKDSSIYFHASKMFAIKATKEGTLNLHAILVLITCAFLCKVNTKGTAS